MSEPNTEIFSDDDDDGDEFCGSTSKRKIEDISENDEIDCDKTQENADIISIKKTKTGHLQQHNGLRNFHLDQNAIFEKASCSKTLLETIPDLAELGVTTVEQDQYELGVIEQIEQALKDEEEDEGEEMQDDNDVEGDNDDNEEEEEPENQTTAAEIKQEKLDNITKIKQSIKQEDDEEEEFDYDDNDNDSNYSPKDDDNSSSINDQIDYEQCEQLFIEDDCDRFEEAPETPFVRVKKQWSKEPLSLSKSRQKDDKAKKIVDDGCMKTYKRRLAEYRLFLHENDILDDDEEYNELHTIEGNFQIPKRIWTRLFKHQQESLKWLWGLHQEHCGGIIGDEMGLGKTIQIIAFLIALKHSKTILQLGEKYRTLGPVLIVCPATVMHQWVHEIHAWWPEFRVSILHSSGSFTGKKKHMVKSFFHDNSIVITTYQGVVIMKEELTEYDWHYVILDEGHKIRNPDAQATRAVKLFNTNHRIILSGSPIQNNLRELWSLFDFVFPGKLGELNTFMSTIATPIRHGGYASASELQIQVAYKCTLLLRDTIKPYLLRRTKDDVKIALNLPAKSEQVLFCKLTERQKSIYKDYIQSEFVQDLKQGLTRVFAALIKIRKICNHPHLFAPWSSMNGDIDFDSMEFFNQAGKMSVVGALLKLWNKQKHKVLLFTQSKQMLDLLEKFVQLKEYTYLRMDGTTTLSSRQAYIRKFNEDPDVFVFLLTTKVGGLGVNLIGGDRVIIYDPDWNPCTDIQARERCWRIGQRKDVIIYRLLCAGTVEEKIYHRQIYKQYLTNSVLKNPHHRRFFKMNDMYDLFTISDESETGIMFSDSKVKFNQNKNRLPIMRYSQQSQDKKGRLITNPNKSLPKIQKKAPEKATEEIEVKLSDEKIQELREKARILSQKLGNKFNSNLSSTSSQNLETNTQKDDDKKKKDKEKRKDRKNKTGMKFEGKRIEYLVKQENFKDENSDGDLDSDNDRTKKKKKKSKNKEKKSKKNEDYLLNKLMGKKQLDVVLQHDTIENVNVPDHYFVEREAEKIANEALEKLRRSGQELQNQANSRAFNLPSSSSSSISSIVPKPADSGSKFSSANLIANLKNRNKTSLTNEPTNKKQASFFSQHEESNGTGSSSSSSADPAVPKTNPIIRSIIEDDFELMQELKNFLRFKASRRCQAKTHEILEYFDGKIAPAKSAVFKSMLKKLCFKEQRKKGHAIWRLKPEFQA